MSHQAAKAAAAGPRRLRHESWADVDDSESDGEFSSEAAFDASLEEAVPLRGNLVGVAQHDPSRSLARHRAGEAALNCEAVEFIPTLSMHCPLVGMCVLEPEADARGTGELLAGSTFEDQLGSSTAAGRRRRHRKAKKPQQKPQEIGVMPEASDETWQHRAEMRVKELAALEAKLYAASQGKYAAKDTNKDETLMQPDPTDRTVSRRQWKRATDQWFKALLRQWCPEEGHGSVASTEELQSLATLSTHCDGESECSD